MGAWRFLALSAESPHAHKIPRFMEGWGFFGGGGGSANFISWARGIFCIVLAHLKIGDLRVISFLLEDKKDAAPAMWTHYLGGSLVQTPEPEIMSRPIILLCLD